MQTFALGKIAVPTAEPRFPCRRFCRPVSRPNGKCAAIVVSPPASNTRQGRFWHNGLYSPTLVGAVKEFAPPASSGVKDSYTHAHFLFKIKGIRVTNDYAIDVGVSGEGLIVSIFVR